MEPIAVKVIDPSRQQWAQLLDPRVPVRTLLPELVHRMALPERLNYDLVRLANDRPFGPDQTLGTVGVIAGETLLVRPVKDGLLADVLDALYKEGLNLAAQGAWGEVLARLQRIDRLDPHYPDSSDLRRRAMQAGATGYASGTTAGSVPAGAGSPVGTGAGMAAGVGAGARGVVGQAGSSGGVGVIGCLFWVVAIVAVGIAVIIWTGNSQVLPPWVCEPLGLDCAAPASGPATVTTPDGQQVTVGSGDVRVSLVWDTTDDVDLHVYDPAGEHIYYGHRTAASGGQLDVDARAGCNDRPSVENVFWPTGQAPSGTYRVDVNHFSTCSPSGVANYTVEVYLDGRLHDRQSGTLDGSSPQVTVAQFTR